MRYSEGTIAIVGGQAVVGGSGTAFKAAEIPVGAAFTLDGFAGMSHVAAIVSDTEIRLSRPFPGLPEGVRYEGLAYVISDDYTAHYNLPYPQEGDQDAAELYVRSMRVLDRVLGG